LEVAVVGAGFVFTAGDGEVYSGELDYSEGLAYLVGAAVALEDGEKSFIGRVVDFYVQVFGVEV
jgi:hypothetical protein